MSSPWWFFCFWLSLCNHGQCLFTCKKDAATNYVVFFLAAQQEEMGLRRAVVSIPGNWSQVTRVEKEVWYSHLLGSRNKFCSWVQFT